MCSTKTSCWLVYQDSYVKVCRFCCSFINCRSSVNSRKGFFSSFSLLLTIHTPSNGTFSWNLFRLSYHHSWVTLLEKSGYAVRPGHTYRKLQMKDNQVW